MGFIKNIPLPPTKMSFDLWVADEFKADTAEAMQKHYDVSLPEINETITEPNMVITMENGDRAECGQRVSIILLLEPDVSIPTMVHECYHVVAHLAKIIGAGITGKAEEWGAYMIEYVIGEAMGALQENTNQ